MVYKLSEGDRRIIDDIPLTRDGLQCYADIGDPDFDMSMDELLYERSAFEFVREQLSQAQVAELEKVDAFWRANAKQFNETFARWHNKKVIATELDEFISDENGKTPPIPRSHWWWWPIEGDAS